MITFILDKSGNLIERFPERRAKGEVRLYKASCTLCEREYSLNKGKKVTSMKCSCEAKAANLLEFEGRKQMLEDWAKEFPTVNFSSAKVRLSNRQTGKRDCTDQEVIWGYGKNATGKILFQYTGEERWISILSEELNKRLHKMPLLDAVVQSVQYVMKTSKVSLVSQVERIFTSVGLKFEYLDQTMVDLLENNDGDVDRLKDFLRSECELSDMQVDSFFL